MYTHANFEMIGRVAKITSRDAVSYLTVAGDDAIKDESGAFEDRPWFNDLAAFGAVKEGLSRLRTGDLVRAVGTIRPTQYENDDGMTVYATGMTLRKVSILARSSREIEEEA